MGGNKGLHLTRSQLQPIKTLAQAKKQPDKTYRRQKNDNRLISKQKVVFSA